MRLGCVGIGSNAIRLLTAQWADGRLCAERRERRGTRLFAGLVNGRLTEDSIRSSVSAVRELVEIARCDGTQEIFVFATSAVRDAVNGAEFQTRCEAACGVKVEIASGEEEAALSYMGASEGGLCGVIDIGGGSTEYILGDDDRILKAVSLQMGAVRLNALKPIMTEEDYQEAMELCQRHVQEGTKELLAFEKREKWIGVGGTMTMLGAMQRGIPLFAAGKCEGMCVSLKDVEGWGHRLSALTLQARGQVPGMMPHRADIMPCGLAILEASMRVLGIETIQLSAHGNMDGYLKKKFKKIEKRC